MSNQSNNIPKHLQVVKPNTQINSVYAATLLEIELGYNDIQPQPIVKHK